MCLLQAYTLSMINRIFCMHFYFVLTFKLSATLFNNLEYGSGLSFGMDENN